MAKKKTLAPGSYTGKMKKVKMTKYGLQMTVTIEGVDHTYTNKVKKDGKSKG